MIRTRTSMAAVVALMAVLAGCRLPTVGEPLPLAFDLVEPCLADAPLACSPQTLWETPEGSLALACADATRTPPETVVLVSRDGGATWVRTGGIPGGLSDPQIVDEALHIVRGREGRLWHAVSTDLGRSWSRESMIVDYPVTMTNPGDVAIAGGSGTVLVAWSERREGGSAVYVSRSDDQGRTWQAPRLVERGASGKSMTRLNAAVSGEWVAVAWADDRDPATLFDIRSALSGDGGKTWRPSTRVNDDAEAVWQDRPAVALRADRLLVLFDDFREPWIEGDRDYNIYAAYSRPTGPVFPNTRVNDRKPGMQLAPRLAVSPDGQRIAALWWDLGESLFGELSVSQSLDWGRSWSPQTRATGWAPGTENNGGRLAFASSGRLVVAATMQRDGRPALAIARERAVSSAAPPVRRPAPANETSLPSVRLAPSATGLSSDDFAAEAAPAWQPVRGTWLVHDGSFVGFGETETLAVRRGPEVADGEFTGRFRLDPIEHRSARLFVRARSEADGWHGYVVENFFRMGVRLWRQEGSRRIPMASALFPFQRDHWYRFRLVLVGTRLDYAIDNRLLLQSDGLSDIEAARVGLGGEYFPVYFDDVTIRVSGRTDRE